MQSTRVILPNVPKIHFYDGGPRCPEDLCFPSVMRAVLEYLGENLGCKHCRVAGSDWGLKCSYSYFLGVSGAGLLMSWMDGWRQESFDLAYLPGDLLEPYRWTFKSIGFGCEILGPEAGEEALRARIVESIRERGKPLIAFGVVGPPEPLIITGYDEDGAVLTGWSFFQQMPPFNAGLEFEDGGPEYGGPEGYFRKRDWFPELHRLIVIGEKGPTPDQGQVFAESLRYALETLRTPKVTRNGAFSHTGPSGYEAWAAHLLHDDFAGLDEAELVRRYQAHDQMVGMVAEARWYASQWLINTFERVNLNAAEELLKAAGSLAGEHELMWRAWELCGGNGNPNGWQKLAGPLVRAQLAAVVEQSRAKYVETAEHIQRALEKI